MHEKVTTLAPRAAQPPQFQVAPRTIEEVKTVAMAFANSGFFKDSREAPQAFVKILAGQEFGLGPIAAMMGIFIVKDKPTLSATTIAGIIKKSGRYDFRSRFLAKTIPSGAGSIEVCVGCEITFYEAGEEVGVSTFTQEDAVAAGLTSNETYKKFPRNMYFSRALTNGARWYCPDVFGGAIYTPDELDEKIQLSSTGEPINYEGPQSTALPPTRKPLSNAALVALYGEAVAKLTRERGASVIPEKLADWLVASGIAPDLKERVDAVTGKRGGLTNEEKFAAEDAIRSHLAPLVVEGDYELPPDDEPAATNANNPAAQAVDSRPYVEAVPGARAALMAAFGEKDSVLQGMFPDVTSKDGRRHAFAVHVLGKPSLSSSKTWDAAQYHLVFEALEKLR